MREIYILHNLIGQDAFKGQDGLLINDVDKLLDSLNDERLIGCSEIMYGRVPKFKTPMDALILFIRGIKKSGVFEFAQFMDELK